MHDICWGAISVGVMLRNEPQYIRGVGEGEALEKCTSTSNADAAGHARPTRFSSSGAYSVIKSKLLANSEPRLLLSDNPREAKAFQDPSKHRSFGSLKQPAV